MAEKESKKTSGFNVSRIASYMFVLVQLTDGWRWFGFSLVWRFNGRASLDLDNAMPCGSCLTRVDTVLIWDFLTSSELELEFFSQADATGTQIQNAGCRSWETNAV